MKNKDMVKIKLPRITGKEESVFVSVGELSWRIRRGYEVEIPLCAYDVLLNAELAEDSACVYMESIQ